MRFDDSLDTVLSADMSTAFGAQTAWRQLVDLIGRGRAPASEMAITRLRSIRPQVPSTIRAASARALAFARPPAPLVRLFAEEDLAISAPVLRMADLKADQWIAMLADLSPAARSVLRHRRDLPADVTRALETYGPIDFILPASALEPVIDQPELGADPVIADVADMAEAEAAQVEVVDAAVEAEAEAGAEAAGTELNMVEVPESTPTDEPAQTDAETEPYVEFGAAFLAALAADIPAPSPLAQNATNGPPLGGAPQAEFAALPFAADAVTPATIAALASVPVPANDIAPAVAEIGPQPVDASEAIPESLPEHLPAQVFEPLSIDWTAVIAARPPEPGRAVIKRRPPNVPPIGPSGPPLTVIEPSVVSPEAIAAAPLMTEPAPLALSVADDLPLPIDPPAQSGAMSFVSIASVAFGLPVVVEALRHHDQSNSADPEAPVVEAPDAEAPYAAPVTAITPAPADSAGVAPASTPETVTPRGPFQISDLVARIDAFQRQRDEDGLAEPGAAIANDTGEALAAPEGFSFETDARGMIVWVSGVSRAALIGVSLDGGTAGAAAQVDGVAAGAFRRRSAFAQARLLVEGLSDAAGQWRISGVPAFDRATGRFTGYRGTARRPRADERAEPAHTGRSPATDSLRQLVHELRTPTTAIAGFAEMIEGELLGPVAGAYRDYAGTIRDQAMGLLGAIDDLDTAARIEAHALDLRATDIPVALLLQRIALDLEPLAALRGTALALDIAAGDVAIRGDDRAVDRLFARLLAALVAAGSAGETIAARMGREGDETVAIHIDRPRALAAYAGDALLMIDAEAEAEATGAPLLGTGFALRLARNLAVELGGSLTIGVDRLTLRLPAAFTHEVGQASTI